MSIKARVLILNSKNNIKVLNAIKQGTQSERNYQKRTFLRNSYRKLFCINLQKRQATNNQIQAQIQIKEIAILQMKMAQISQTKLIRFLCKIQNKTKTYLPQNLQLMNCKNMQNQRKLQVNKLDQSIKTVRLQYITQNYIIELFLMFGEMRLQEVTIHIRNKQKQEELIIELTINQCGQINLSELSNKIRCHMDIIDEPLIFYYDFQQEVYVLFQGENDAMMHFSLLAPEGMCFIIEDIIQLRIEEKISDELLANPAIKPESVKQKRSPERDISQAFQLVEQWRYLHKNGTFNEKGQWQKINLQKSAMILDIPRKTLQDYYLLFRNGYSLGFNFRRYRRQKIGHLRLFVRQNKKPEKQKSRPKQQQQEQILKILRRYIFRNCENQMQEQLFKVIENHSSDEDVIQEQYIFEN